MKDLLARVKPACDAKSVMPAEAAISVVNGRIEARSANLRASIPCDLDDFAVAAVDLDFALKRHDDEPEFKITADHVTINGCSRLKRVNGIDPLIKPEVDTLPFDDAADLVEVLTEVIPFSQGSSMATREWTRGARFDGELVTASDTVTLIQSRLKKTSKINGITLRLEALEYLRDHAHHVAALGILNDSLLIEMKDGGWVHMPAFATGMPDSAVDLINNYSGFDTLPEITDEYMGALRRSIDWADETIEIRNDRIITNRYSTEHTEFAESNVEKQLLDSRHLKTVLAVATHADFAAQPVLFKTRRDARGLFAVRLS